MQRLYLEISDFYGTFTPFILHIPYQVIEYVLNIVKKK